LIKKFLPKLILSTYHFILALLSALFYGLPSRKLIVIGVTGTNGKTTTCHLIAEILERAGKKVGMTTSIDFKIGKKIWANNTKQGMQGRFKLQKLLKRMAKAKCDYAIIETTSEGIKQFRHCFIDYHIAVLTNVTPDHLEAHGGMEKYCQAKEELFKYISKKSGKNKNYTSVINLDSPFFKKFLQYEADNLCGYEIEKNNLDLALKNKIIRAEKIKYHDLHSHFNLATQGGNIRVKLNLPGKFNIYNGLAAACTALSQKIGIKTIKKTFFKISLVSGRMEEIKNEKNFRIFVDYAHSEDALLNVYDTIAQMPHNKIIAVLGATGGGRDKSKRPILGELAGKYADIIIITNEDPYNEDPEQIMDQVLEGVYKIRSKTDQRIFKIISRKKAIHQALKKAEKNDIVIITGKGAETVMAVKGGKFVPFDDREIVREWLKGDKN